MNSRNPGTYRHPRSLWTAAVLSLLVGTAVCLAPAPAGADDPPPPPFHHGPSAYHHDPNGFSLGVILGDPTGLTLRGGIGDRHAIQAHFGFSPFPGDGMVAMVDWTYDAWDFLHDNPTAGLLFYFGFGAKGEWFTGRYFAYKRDGKHSLPDRSHFGVGMRGLVGLRAPFRDAPFDLFLEVAPAGILFVIPAPGVYYDVDLALGFRYRF